MTPCTAEFRSRNCASRSPSSTRGTPAATAVAPPRRDPGSALCWPRTDPIQVPSPRGAGGAPWDEARCACGGPRACPLQAGGAPWDLYSSCLFPRRGAVRGCAATRLSTAARSSYSALPWVCHGWARGVPGVCQERSRACQMRMRGVPQVHDGRAAAGSGVKRRQSLLGPAEQPSGKVHCWPPPESYSRCSLQCRKRPSGSSSEVQRFNRPYGATCTVRQYSTVLFSSCCPYLERRSRTTTEPRTVETRRDGGSSPSCPPGDTAEGANGARGVPRGDRSLSLRAALLLSGHRALSAREPCNTRDEAGLRVYCPSHFPGLGAGCHATPTRARVHDVCCATDDGRSLPYHNSGSSP